MRWKTAAVPALATLVAVLSVAALGAFRPATVRGEEEAPVLTAVEFAGALQRTSDAVERILRGMDDVASARVSVRSVSDHEPLHVDVKLDWTRPPTEFRRAAVASWVRGAFAPVADVLAEVDP